MFGEADIVHSEELSLWFSADVARLKRRFGFKLAVTVWETFPLLRGLPLAARPRRARETLAEADLYLPATDRARHGAAAGGRARREDRRQPPRHRHRPLRRGRRGRDAGRARDHLARAGSSGRRATRTSCARWPLIRRGHVPGGPRPFKLRLVGSGPEGERLRTYASELGIADAVEFRSVPYDEMPALFASASAMVLASLPRSGCALHPGDIPRCFWEEQFGLVLAEAMAAGVPLLARRRARSPRCGGPRRPTSRPATGSTSRAQLAAGPLSQPPGQRAQLRPRARRAATRSPQATERIAAAYDRLLS